MLSYGWVMIMELVVVLGLWVFISKRKHLLVTLLSLEFIVLGLYMLLFYYLVGVHSGLYLTMAFLTFAVCEGALGLAIMVSMIRTHGNDYFQGFSMLQC